MTIRYATPDDAASIAEIYNHYVKKTVITFEETPVTVDEMGWRISQIRQINLPWIVFENEQQNQVFGFAYAGEFRKRTAYRYTVETAVYIEAKTTGRGIGVQLYAQLIEDLKTKEIHSVMGCIALPNPASVKLHENMGFKQVGLLSQVGYKFHRWIDVGYWQLLLET